MKLYHDLDVELTHHNFGTSWVGILRGSEENIETVFNGLFNHGATNGSHEFQDHAKTVSVFWTSEQAMLTFFFNRANFDDGLPEPYAHKRAAEMLAKFKANDSEFFLDFSKKFLLECHALGTLRAERPDTDLKDAIITHAYQPLESQCCNE